MLRFIVRLLPASVVLAVGCAPHVRVQTVVPTGFFKQQETCRQEYAEMDARVTAAGVGDATYYRVPGFPYFRTDRLLSSFGDEVTGFEETGGWVRRMRELDQESRLFEYENLGLSTQEVGILRHRFIGCGAVLAGLELENPENMKILRQVARPSDEYSDTARNLGLYALSVPILKARQEAWRMRTRKDFAKPLAALDSPGPMALWSVRALKDPELISKGLRNAFHDELGIPGQVDSQWVAYAEAHAPKLWIETSGDQDLPGTPVWTHQGLRVDTAQALVNYTISFTRFGGKALTQITYFMWFKGSAEDVPIDGIMWRVTLDEDAKPLTYESLHTSGRHYQVFPVQNLQQREHESYWQQAVFFPQNTDSIPSSDVAVRIGSGAHNFRRVVHSLEAKAQKRGSYELRRYENLYRLKTPDGGTRSMFGPDGIVAGTDTPVDEWMWTSGVAQPGALRQYGRQPISYIGKQHFDNPFLLESIFIPPTAAAEAPAG